MGFPLDDFKKELAEQIKSASPEISKAASETLKTVEDRADAVKAKFIQDSTARRQARNSK